MSPLAVAALGVMTVAVLLIWVMPAILARRYRPTLRADEVLFTVTEDSFRLPLLRYPAQGPIRRRLPVILCPGLGSNRYSFDLGEGAPSLAVTLSQRGFEVFVVELRGWGHGDHTKPLWDFDAFVERDAPKLIEWVRARTGAPAVHWVGHSMGGMVLLAGLARGLADVRCGVTLGSTLNFHGTDHGFDSYLELRPVIKRVSKLPYDRLARLIVPFAARLPNPVDDINLNVSNCDPPIVRRLDAVGFTPISPDVTLQLLNAVEPGGLRSNHEGEAPFLARLAERDDAPPVLMMAGEGDVQCPFEAVERVARSQPGFRALAIGPGSGAEMAYGHFDMLMGARADTEVFPHVVGWLERHDDAGDEPG